MPTEDLHGQSQHEITNMNSGPNPNHTQLEKKGTNETNQQSSMEVEDQSYTIDAEEDFLSDLKLQHGEPDSQKKDNPIKGLSGSQINIVVDGVSLNLSPRPIIQNGSTLIPIRAISTHFGAGVLWNDQTRTVTINKGDTSIVFQVGSTTARVNGKQVTVPPSQIINNSTFVPIRFISETFAYSVEWNDRTRTVTIETTPNAPISTSSYTVVSGDSLWSIANRFGTTVDELRRLNNLTSDLLRVGQTLVVSGSSSPETNTGNSPTQQTTFYTVVSGDTLSRIASRFNTTVNWIMTINKLSSDRIFVGQVLEIPTNNNNSNSNNSNSSEPVPTNQSVTKTFTTHTVRSGDNAWNLSIQYGIPMLELLQVNNLNINSVLNIGQMLTIPVYTVPVKPVVSSRHGEFLDWWTEARYVFPIGKEAMITDFNTGRTFRVRHTMGGNHADAEPLTSTDAETMRQIWGGSFSWTPRAVIISVDGRRLAAAMHSFPHADQAIRTNNYPGHFCIHFLNSTRHNDGLVQPSMQSQIRISAGTDS